MVPDYMAQVQEGAFYGWPWYTIGDREDPARVGQRPDLKGDVRVPEVLIQAHSSSLGLAFYDGKRFPAWRGNLFAGSLKNRMLVRMELDGDTVVHQERLLGSLRQRVRDVRQGPDGLLYVLTDETDGQLLRLEPLEP